MLKKSIFIISLGAFILSGCTGIEQEQVSEQEKENIQKINNQTTANAIKVESPEQFSKRMQEYISQDSVSIGEIVDETNEYREIGFMVYDNESQEKHGLPYNMYFLPENVESELVDYLKGIELVKNVNYNNIDIWDYLLDLSNKEIVDYSIGPYKAHYDMDAVWYGISPQLKLVFVLMEETVNGFNVVNDPQFFETINTYFEQKSLSDINDGK